MSKKPYCSNCETYYSIEPSFYCTQCCCKDCKYKNCKCLNKNSICTSKKISCTISYTDIRTNKIKSLYCITCFPNGGSNEPNFICSICCCKKCSKKNTECKCNSYSSLSDYYSNLCERCNSKSYKKCDCTFCTTCSKYKTLSRWSKYYNCCYDCYQKNICFCNSLSLSHKSGFCYHCDYGDFL